MKAKRKPFKNFGLGQAIAFIVILVHCLLFCFLLYWILVSSLKHRLDFRYNLFGFPSGEWGIQWDNFVKGFNIFYVPINNGRDEVYFFQMMLNSFLYAGGCAIVSVATKFVVAYVCATNRDKVISKIVFNTVIIVSIIPVISTPAAELNIARTLGLYNSMLGQYVMKMSFTGGSYYLIFYALVKGLDSGYFEAAEIDGAGKISVMLKICFPLLFPSILGITVLEFISYWADFYTPLYYLPSHPVISYGLYKLQSTTITEVTIPVKFACCLISCIPTLTLFIIFRNKFMGNLTMGGMKG